jgi:hypothetical protein
MLGTWAAAPITGTPFLRDATPDARPNRGPRATGRWRQAGRAANCLLRYNHLIW